MNNNNVRFIFNQRHSSKLYDAKQVVQLEYRGSWEEFKGCYPKAAVNNSAFSLRLKKSIVGGVLEKASDRI